jgi:oligoendopeptidase F
MKVCDLPYSRYEVERAKKAFDVAIEKIKNANSAEEVLTARKALLDEMDELGTQSSLSYMRWSCNTKDDFYKGEKEYYEQNMPLLSGVQIEYTQAMMNTPFKDEVQKLFIDIRDHLKET